MTWKWVIHGPYGGQYRRDIGGQYRRDIGGQYRRDIGGQNRRDIRGKYRKDIGGCLRIRYLKGGENPTKSLQSPHFGWESLGLILRQLDTDTHRGLVKDTPPYKVTPVNLHGVVSPSCGVTSGHPTWGCIPRVGTSHHFCASLFCKLEEGRGGRHEDDVLERGWRFMKMMC